MAKKDSITDLNILYKSNPNDTYIEDVMTAMALNQDVFGDDLLRAISLDLHDNSIGNLPLKEKAELIKKYDGEIKIGYSEELDCNIGLSKVDLTKNILIAGNPGAGKTNLMTVLIIQILNE